MRVRRTAAWPRRTATACQGVLGMGRKLHLHCLSRIVNGPAKLEHRLLRVDAQQPPLLRLRLPDITRSRFGGKPGEHLERTPSIDVLSQGLAGGMTSTSLKRDVQASSPRPSGPAPAAALGRGPRAARTGPRLVQTPSPAGPSRPRCLSSPNRAPIPCACSSLYKGPRQFCAAGVVCAAIARHHRGKRLHRTAHSPSAGASKARRSSASTWPPRPAERSRRPVGARRLAAAGAM